jgi:hypothetical protein
MMPLSARLIYAKEKVNMLLISGLVFASCCCLRKSLLSYSLGKKLK